MNDILIWFIIFQQTRWSFFFDFILLSQADFVNNTKTKKHNRRWTELTVSTISTLNTCFIWSRISSNVVIKYWNWALRFRILLKRDETGLSTMKNFNSCFTMFLHSDLLFAFFKFLKKLFLGHERKIDFEHCRYF